MHIDNKITSLSKSLLEDVQKVMRGEVPTKDVQEEIKGWKNAARDISKFRKQKSDSAKQVKLVKIKKDGSESKMHDAVSRHSDEKEAREKHANRVKLNPGMLIRHNLYVDGKLVDTLKEDVDQIDELSVKTLKSYKDKADNRDTMLATNKIRKANNSKDYYTQSGYMSKDGPKVAASNPERAKRSKPKSSLYDHAETDLGVNQIDELSKTTLASYIKKAGGTSFNSVGHHMYQSGNTKPNESDRQAYKRSHVDKLHAASNKLFKQAVKRAKGVELAADKIVRESVDENNQPDHVNLAAEANEDALNSLMGGDRKSYHQHMSDHHKHMKKASVGTDMHSVHHKWAEFHRLKAKNIKGTN